MSSCTTCFGVGTVYGTNGQRKPCPSCSGGEFTAEPLLQSIDWTMDPDVAVLVADAQDAAREAVADRDEAEVKAAQLIRQVADLATKVYEQAELIADLQTALERAGVEVCRRRVLDRRAHV